MLVTEVVEKANGSLDALMDMVEGLPVAIVAAPKTIGEWSIKDVLAHLIGWGEEAARAFETWKVGVEPDWSHISDIDDFNNSSVKGRRRQSLAKVSDQLRLIHNGIIDHIKTVPESEFKRRGGIPKWLITLMITHVDEHQRRIEIFKRTLETESAPIEISGQAEQT